MMQINKKRTFSNGEFNDQFFINRNYYLKIEILKKSIAKIMI